MAEQDQQGFERTDGATDRVSDQELVRRFQHGDKQVFAALVERHRRHTAVLAHRLLGWSDDIDDVCQEAFLSAFLGLKRFHGRCSFRTWLFRITVNKCRTHQRQRWLRIRRFRPLGAGVMEDRSHPARPVVTDAETAQVVRQAVRALPGRYREAIVLRYLQEMEPEAAAAVLGITPNAFHVRLSRARKMLATKLKETLEL